MRILGIIPARAGSKRIPSKNLRLIGGKPLVLRALETALEARRLMRVVLSSDDAKALEIARNIDPALALERPAVLATDTSVAIDYVRHALEVLEGDGSEPPYDVVVIVQPSSPFTLATDIDRTVELLEETNADTAVSVMALDHAIHPLKLKRMARDGRLLPYLSEEQGRMAAHELPDLYVRNGSVYATRRAVIDAGAIIGADCRGYLMPRERSIDINDELDLRFAEFLLASQA